MENVTPELLVKILRDCCKLTPDPLYPAEYAERAGLERSLLDRALDQLRLGDWLRLTDWVSGKGQGYALTPAGAETAVNPRLLMLLRLVKEVGGACAALPGTGSSRLEPVAANAAADPTTWDRGDAVRACLTEISPPVVTMSLIFLNVAMFLLGGVLAHLRDVPPKDFLAFRSDNQILLQLQIDMGALRLLEVFGNNQWWRLFSYDFLHSGLLHIGMNMFALYSIGPLLESMWGRGRYLYLYLASGMLGGIAVAWADEPRQVLVGASGAVCGLLTSMVFWILLNRKHLGEDQSRQWLRNILLNILLMAFISAVPGVSALGHFGGGIAGLAIAYPMTYRCFGKPWQRRLGLAGMLAVPCAGAGVLWVLDMRNGDRARVSAIMVPFFIAEKKIEQVIRDHIAPLFLAPAGALADDPDKFARAAQASLRTHQLIQEELRNMDAVRPLRQSDWNKEISLIPQYLQLSAALFDQFARDLERPARRPALRQAFQEWHNVRNVLIANKHLQEITGLRWTKSPGD